MLTEPDFSRFFSVAPDLQLSSELKNAIRKIIKVSPALYDEDEPAFKVLRSQIICLLNENEYTPLAYSQDGMDGKLANAYLADEAGALDDYPVEAMRSSQIEASNIRYIIHDERDSDTDSYINRYINCHFKFDNSDNDTPGRTAQCIGGGLGIDGYIDINGGVFESIDTTKTGHICVVSYHNFGNRGSNH